MAERLAEGALWPEPLIQLNPSFEPGEWIDDLVASGVLHEECARIFRIKPEATDPGRPLRLYRHQADAIRAARSGQHYVLTTGTGSGKSLSYIVPIVDHVLRRGSGRGIQAIVVYPMNALANSQMGELRKFLCHGYPEGHQPVTFARYTGQEGDEERKRIIANPPDILLTNYVMLELILTRPYEQDLVQAARGLRFLVLDELHTYRGRQGADVALLVRRTREALEAKDLQCVGTSATLAGGGTFAQQQREVASVASLLFGVEVRPEYVIGETLRRATPEWRDEDPEAVRALAERVADPPRTAPRSYDEFVRDPLASWIESTFGVRAEAGTGRLLRATPRAISGDEGAARLLSQLTSQPEERCVEAIRQTLLAGYAHTHPETGFPAFAFRLHQFISRGDAVYASVEPEQDRFLTLQGQQFVPGDRGRVLLPLVFCRECGQDYYAVWQSTDPATGRRGYRPRELADLGREPGQEAGFLYAASTPWPDDSDEVLERLPEDWTEERNGVRRLRRERQPDLPRPVHVGPDGIEHDRGTRCAFIGAPFQFCLTCGVEYSPRQTDFAKLASLSSEGRSTATTVLSLFAVHGLRREDTLSEKARKLLSFTDNRQDASLQAGHFNDFVEIALLRSALYRAVAERGAEGLEHDQITASVFQTLNLDLALYAADPQVRFAALTDTQRALREVLGYRLYRDLKRGWRITSPNLEQCGLLEISYPSLDEVCAAQDVWQRRHPALVSAAPATRYTVAKVLLDLMRRELAIKVDYLDQVYQERIKQQSSQRLIAPWAIDEQEVMEHAAVLYPRARAGAQDYGGHVYLSGRSRFGQYLRRGSTFPDFGQRISVADSEGIIRDLLDALRVAGLVQVVDEPHGEGAVPGYQIPAAALRWKAGDGTQAFYDPLRTPNAAGEGGRTNPFFVEFYRTVAGTLQGYEAREHTAQVPYDRRVEREGRFREGKLPVLYCSPTMELGVDIAELNVVNLRNVPPTPANYAQRSGRAGRSGQPAFVFTYCSTFWPHDQYFFKRPEQMVAGAVSPPRLDLANEDLVRAHVHSIWLAETGLSLGSSLKDVLDLAGERPSLELQEHVRATVTDAQPRRRARERAQRVLASIGTELQQADWWNERWLDEVLAQVPLRFEQACDRWRGLYRAAFTQAEVQSRIIRDASRSARDKEQAKRLRGEAEAQLRLLTQEEDFRFSDFYSYRYFASEGFLPGYNFPRLPLSAYIPGRRGRQNQDEFVQRPRFLAISEFGPRAIVYHEGSRYVINKVILPVRARDGAEPEGLVLTRAKQCAGCSYLHPGGEDGGADVCERCGRQLPMPLTDLLRMQNVSTRRRDRITSDEEERQRLGYELRTGIRFAQYGGRPSFRRATVRSADGDLFHLIYGHAATIWRINLGWRRRRDPNQYGFVLDTERGYWATSEAEVQGDPDDPLSNRAQRVIPYVEDRRNCLLIEPAHPLEPAVMASLQAAIKNAIQVVYQLEDSELAAEPLPSEQDRRALLLYESAEGGAGVLRRLVEDPATVATVAREALRLCHFDPETGEDRRRAPRAREDCEAACYDCLMSYYNQRDHALLDRQLLKDLLVKATLASVEVSPAEVPQAEHLARLHAGAGSDLERDWLRLLTAHDLRLPTAGQKLIVPCKTCPDFLYEEEYAAIYVDGPPHEFPDRQERDRQLTECLEQLGYTVLRFGHRDDWLALIRKHPSVFGALREQPREPAVPAPTPHLDRELFDPRWHALLTGLVAIPEIVVEAGGDVLDARGVVAGRFEAAVRAHNRTVWLVDGADPACEQVAAVAAERGVSCLRLDGASTPQQVLEVLGITR